MPHGRIKILGMKGVQGKLNRIKKKVPAEAANAINKSLVVVDKEVKINLTGKLLNVQTGLLHRGWSIRLASVRNLSGKLGTKVKYARIHEFGGRTGRGYKTKLRARHYLRAAVKSSTAKIHRIFDNALDKVASA